MCFLHGYVEYGWQLDMDLVRFAPVDRPIYLGPFPSQMQEALEEVDHQQATNVVDPNPCRVGFCEQQDAHGMAVYPMTSTSG